MNILFMGTPDFAATSLRGLCEGGYNVTGVISQPDKPKNRGMQMQATPVKQCAQEFGIDVYQPETLKDGAIQDYLDKIKPDIIVVVAYGKLLPPYVLDYPKYGCINIHGSLLPKYRGAAPIQWSILSGDKVTGVTSMYMARGMDTGDMILKKEVEITDDMDAGALHDVLAVAGAQLLKETLDVIKAGTAPRIPQNDEEATYASMLRKEMGLVDWNKSAEEIWCQIRGLSPWPSAYSFADGKRFKILSASVCDKNGTPGQVLENKNSIVIATGKGALEIHKLQFENKRAMTAAEYLVGNGFDKVQVD
ncbi:MAG: methionyl-tRNA formyltransferase [Clostridia bacterium]|nr:methionyl-tRNA formyltransferase [Clostridia bacterium]